jgi:cytochrome c-type biogenesis protein
VLSAILTVSASQATVAEGAALLLVYSLGLAVPFLLTALFTAPFMRMMVHFRRYIGHIERVMGVALVLTGALFLTGGPGIVSQWLIDTFPGLSNLIL